MVNMYTDQETPKHIALFKKIHTCILGECRAFVGERNDRKRQDRLRLRVARGRMRTDRGRLMTYKHTNIQTYIQTESALSSLVRARCARPISCLG